MTNLSVLCLVIAGLALCNGQGGTISFKLNNYLNRGGKGANGNCCDGIFPVCKKSSQCDQYFKICLDNPESDNDDMTTCPLGKYTTGVTEQNVITFGSTIDSTPNPKVLTFDGAWPYNLKIKVQVWDEDGTDWLGNANDDDFVEYLDTIQSIHPDGHANTITLAGRTTLVATITVTCNSAGMTDDCVTPPPATAPPAANAPPVVIKHRAPIQCYECSTIDMTTMTTRAQWEELTKRDMSYVEVSDQCQDVAAVPNQFLQNCEGVCLTGLWNETQDFIFRTCVAVTQDCDDIDDEGDATGTYHCSNQAKGNNGRYIIEGVAAPPSDVVEPEEAPVPLEQYEEDGTWLSCYECSSKHDTDGQCEDPFDGEVERVNCTLHAMYNEDPVQIHNMTDPNKGIRCFKSVSTIYDSRSKVETKMVKRGCGYVEENYCTYSLSPSSGKTQQCYCDQHDCNSATPITFSIATILAAILLGVHLP